MRGLMPKKTKQVRAALLRKGFTEKGKRHERLVYTRLDGTKTSIRTETSHGERELHDGLLAEMAKQVKLSRTQFDELVECPMDRARYEQVVENTGHFDCP
jgi:predicted RNA binding protein YcfA (HicA-like mRNA interferase family)